MKGGVDDIWQDTITNQLIIGDYKSQAKNGRLDKKDFLDDPLLDAYKIQMNFYSYLLSGMGFSVDPISYFLVCNAKRDEDEINKTMRFDEYLVPYKWRIDWIETQLDKMVEVMNQSNLPASNKSCKNWAYADKFQNNIFSKCE